MEYAKIHVLEDEDNKPQTIKVMFNPSEYMDSKEVKTSGQGANSQFQITEKPDFNLSLFFDTYDQGTDVRNEFQQIVDLTKPAIGKLARKRPPVCLFEWGFFKYKGWISKVDQKFTMFRQDGTPVRAEVTVTFKYYVTPQEEERNQGGDNCRRLWTVKSGERLDLIAYRALEDPGWWPKIAKLNQIADPLLFPREMDIGRTLVIPDHKELKA